MTAPATEVITRIVREIVAPGLKSAGFRRNRQIWTHVSETAHRGLHLQRSQFNTTHRARFTFNVHIAFLALGDRPFVTDKASTLDVLSPGHKRIGRLIAADHDFWWEVVPTSRDESDPLLDRFAQDWDEKILPVVEAATEPRRFCLHLLDSPSVNTIEIGFRYAMRMEDAELAESFYERAVELARSAQTWTRTPGGATPASAARALVDEIGDQIGRPVEDLR